MQYTIMTMFSVNMLLKVVISSSAAVMWSLIHVLQLFRYILFINVNTPNIMATLISYLAIVVGDTGDSEKYVPNIIDQYMINSSDILANFTLYKKFDDNGKAMTNKYRIQFSISYWHLFKENYNNYLLFDYWCSSNIYSDETFT